MGQVASSGVSNLAFFSDARRSINKAGELKNNPTNGDIKYDKSKTYIAFVIGDGDNVSFMKGGRKEWFTDRLNTCGSDTSGKCSFPLLWSVQPNLLTLAPDWLRWYYEK